MSFSRTMLFLFDFCVAIAWPLCCNCLLVVLQLLARCVAIACSLLYNFVPFLIEKNDRISIETLSTFLFLYIFAMSSC